MSIRSICVYCGSAAGNNPEFTAETERFGKALARAGIRLVYGGGSVGLMGILARAILEDGGKVLGIIPRFLRDREVALRELTNLVITDSMHERKQAMFEESDAFVALPGGIGTLEETVEMMTWMQLGQHRKPIVIANLRGFWDPFLNLVRHMEDEGFLHQPGDGSPLYLTVDHVDQILPLIGARSPREEDERDARIPPGLL